MTTNTDIAQLKFNKMSSAKYEELKEAGQLVENEFYITPDGGAMPSSKYVDLELGVSGTTYTALANGYIQFVKQATASGQYMVAYDNDLPSTSVDENTIAIKWSTSGVNDVLYFPVRKGQKFTIGYTFDGPTVAFRIIFAQGDS